MIDIDQMTPLDRIVYGSAFHPYSGWHDDHRHSVRTPQYLPAMQQNRTEFHGYSGASHMVFQSMFENVVTVEWAESRVANLTGSCGAVDTIIIGNTHDPATLAHVTSAVSAGLDLLFIDAAHTIADVRADFEDYAPLVRPGGIIALHDALDRNGHEVHRFLDALRSAGEKVTIIGDDLGIAWMQVSWL